MSCETHRSRIRYFLSVVCFIFATGSAYSAEKTPQQWAKDITAEHLLTDRDNVSPTSKKGKLSFLLKGTQHCTKGKRAVFFDKETYSASTGCWVDNGTKEHPDIVIDWTVKDPGKAPKPAYVFQDGHANQLVILENDVSGCEKGLKKAYLVDKPHTQVLEGCWKKEDSSTFTMTWDTGMTQTTKPIIPQMFLFNKDWKNPTQPETNGLPLQGPQLNT